MPDPLVRHRMCQWRACSAWPGRQYTPTPRRASSWPTCPAYCLLLLLLWGLASVASAAPASPAPPLNSSTAIGSSNSYTYNSSVVVVATTTGASSGTGSSLAPSQTQQAPEPAFLRQLRARSMASLGQRRRQRKRKRHSKRHSNNWYDYYSLEENATALEVVNPCGGSYEPEPWASARRKNPKKIYNDLKRLAINEFRNLNAGPHEINISHMDIWFLHNTTYKFLPKLKENSSVALKRWYRNMQTYVGSFAYLTHVQQQWDHAKSQRESQLTHELKHLLGSAHRMLCELETAINNTRSAWWQSLGTGMSMGMGRGKVGRARAATMAIAKPQPLLTRGQMNRRLKLRTKWRIEHANIANQSSMPMGGRAGGTNSANAGRGFGSGATSAHFGIGELEADRIDCRFVKFYYYEFLKSMWKVLSRVVGRKQAHSQQHPHQHQHQQHPSRLSQQREFNEVEKLQRRAGRRKQARLRKRAHRLKTLRQSAFS